MTIGQSVVKHGGATAHQFWHSEMFPTFTFYWQRNMEYFYSDITLHAVRMNIQSVRALQSLVQSGQTTETDGELRLEELVKKLKETLLEKKPHGWEMLGAFCETTLASAKELRNFIVQQRDTCSR